MLKKDEAIVEPEIKLIDEKELWSSPRGQVQLIPGARSAYDFNVDDENVLAAMRTALWSNVDHARLLEDVRRLAAIRTLDAFP